MNQPNEVTIEDLCEALNLLLAISTCTDDSYQLSWHQSLQENIHGLMHTMLLLDQAPNETLLPERLKNNLRKRAYQDRAHGIGAA